MNIKDEINADPELDEDDKESVTESTTNTRRRAAFAGFIDASRPDFPEWL